jgi:dTDP-4-dehydrorhamnose 3,5-epimerase
MKCTRTRLEGMYLIEPRVFRDERGSFLECWNEQRYRELGIEGPFVQDNASVSTEGVLRGLHFQTPHAQGKLVSVLLGEVFDVAVDLRMGSTTFGQWVGYRLSAENGHQLYIPAGLAHGFVTLSRHAVFSYKCTEYYTPAAEYTLLWNDPDVGIEWPVAEPVLSEKDRAGLPLGEIARLASR